MRASAAKNSERHVPIQQRFHSKFEEQLPQTASKSRAPRPSIRERLEFEIANLQKQIEEVKTLDSNSNSSTSCKSSSNLRQNLSPSPPSSSSQSSQSPQLHNCKEPKQNKFLVRQTFKAKTNLDDLFDSNMTDQQSSTPMSAASGELPHPLAGFGNRATTTERRTTTTTTTKRTIKSSDDFLPGATDIQQVRSESRSGSVSSERPVFGATTQGSTASSTKQHQATSSSTQHTSQSGGDRWTESLQSPVVEDTEDGGKVLKLRFDVTQYEPEDIVVKTIENRLHIQAKHEEKTENRTVYREYNREFHLPDGTDIELIRSSLSKDGILTVECPLPKTQLMAASRRIPIEKSS